MADKIKYGYEFEAKLIISLISNPKFLTQVVEILKPSYFENRTAEKLIGWTIEYYRVHKAAPSLLVYKTEIEKLDELEKPEAVSYLREACKYENSQDLAYVQEQTLSFCKNQALRDAILESANLLKSGQFDQIKNIIDSALKVGLSTDIGHRYLEDFERRYSEESRDCIIPTPWEAINNLLQGGLAKGEFGFLIAPPGAGKSWVLASLGLHAVKLGYTVVHYTLELASGYTGLRYDSTLSGISSTTLKLHQEELRSMVEELPGKLIIEHFTQKSATLLTLRSHLDRCAALGIVPDMIIIDYADLLKGFGKELRFELRDIYESIRTLAGEYSIPIWSASQSNKSGYEEEVIQATQVAEDFSKIATADFVWSLSRKESDKLAGTGRFHIVKNRFGFDGLTFPANFNATNGQINIHSNTVREAVDARKSMQEGKEMIRKQLGRKYHDIFIQKEEKSD